MNEEFYKYFCDNFEDVDGSPLLYNDLVKMVDCEYERLVNYERDQKKNRITSTLKSSVFAQALDNCRRWSEEDRETISAHRICNYATAYIYFKMIRKKK